MIRIIAARLRHFASSVHGSMSAELVIVLPLLMAWVGMSLVFFDGYYMRVVNQKAAYTLSDLMSREIGTKIGPAYIEGMDDVFEFLTAADDASAAIRVSMVYCEDHCAADDPERKLNLDWSHSTSSAHPKLTAADLNSDYLDKIPLAMKADRQIMVETYFDFVPLFNVGLSDTINMETRVITRLRFDSFLEWDDGA
ncbi:hypothetical protein EV663_101168 [Rhodovulum bhavnagarense]|uniref:TadE-like protein n=1 Tax=Rhodovulum bhavnagarense TaxID=992286 RepID=A0A4R2RJI2_9RHOB|nr:hypothetical protein [Rhodovulum bhavnagarense]TCP62908.1 hypothetical protein EV663_101168 [Rhodovulum bhavnagarense]